LEILTCSQPEWPPLLRVALTRVWLSLLLPLHFGATRPVLGELLLARHTDAVHEHFSLHHARYNVQHPLPRKTKSKSSSRANKKSEDETGVAGVAASARATGGPAPVLDAIYTEERALALLAHVARLLPGDRDWNRGKSQEKKQSKNKDATRPDVAVLAGAQRSLQQQTRAFVHSSPYYSKLFSNSDTSEAASVTKDNSEAASQLHRAPGAPVANDPSQPFHFDIPAPEPTQLLATACAAPSADAALAALPFVADFAERMGMRAAAMEAAQVVADHPEGTNPAAPALGLAEKETALLDYVERVLMEALGAEYAHLYEPLVLGCFYGDLLKAHARLHAIEGLV